MKKNILGYTLPKLTEEFLALGQSKFRAKQVFGWIYGKKVYSFDAMTDVSKDFRNVLNSDYCVELPKIFTKQESNDGTIKVLLEMGDGAKVESVLMPYNYGDAVCVSSQVGCNMGCAFCASGLLRKERNLTTAEMVGEVLVMDSLLEPLGRKVTHIDVMGTGEPFDNYDNVLDFVKIANDPFALEIGARHITVSTCGLCDGIKKYGKEGIQINLALSLHAPNDELRQQIMPIAKAYPFSKLIPALQEYSADSGRRLTFEYIMLRDFNDTLDCAKQLVSFIRDNNLFAYVNLIPYNEVKEKPYRRSEKARVNAFVDYLKKNGINCTVRKEFGGDIDAACGQLRSKQVGVKS